MGISNRHIREALALTLFEGLLNPKRRTLYVGSTHANASDAGSLGLNPNNPLKTIKQAMVNVRDFADDGHLIVLLPAHVETINTAAHIDFDVDNLTIMAQRPDNRAPAEQPKFDFATLTAASVAISGDNVKFIGITWENSIASLVKMAAITGHGVQILGCSLNDGAVILVDAFIWTGDYGLVDGLLASAPTAGNQSIIQVTGTDFMEIRECRIRCDGVAGAIENVTTASTRFSYHDNEIETLDVTDICIVTMTADQGWVSNNLLKIATDTIGTWITATGEVALFENYGTNDGAERGIIIGTISVVT